MNTSEYRGHWALVTGASSGIGQALAIGLAKNNISVILVARDREGLDATAKKCQALKVDTQVHVCDLSSEKETVALLAQITKPISILVNNAGFAVHGPFLETSLEREMQMVQLQIQTTLQLTKAFLPQMVKQKRGAILMIGSVYSVSAVPHQSIYGACKSFLLSYSLSLAAELKGTGVSVTISCPGTTRSKFRLSGGIKISNPNAGMSSEDVARISLNALFRKQLVVVPGTVNKFFVCTIRHLPLAWIAPLMKRISRARGLDTETSTPHVANSNASPSQEEH